jgi:hypothetical protein
MNLFSMSNSKVKQQKSEEGLNANILCSRAN